MLKRILSFLFFVFLFFLLNPISNDNSLESYPKIIGCSGVGCSGDGDTICAVITYPDDTSVVCWIKIIQS
jgi:hypothetical protein